MRGKLNRTRILAALGDAAGTAEGIDNEADARLRALFEEADAVRARYVGNEVHLRGLIEFSNRCSRRCAYCGINAGRADLPRYRMTEDEILESVEQAVRLGFGTVVLQAGEDHRLDATWLASVVRSIKAVAPLAITLSVGEWTPQVYELWRNAGADRVLLRFETSNRELLKRIHRDTATRKIDRVELLRELRAMGYEIGSGVMVGLPGQTIEDLASDVELIRDLNLDMVGVGPYVPHPDTALGRAREGVWSRAQRERMSYAMLALVRLVCPFANIPSTSALSTINRAMGRENGLTRGANVVMPNLTPPRYRRQYEIYPAKAAVGEEADAGLSDLIEQIRRLGRSVGVGRGDSAAFEMRVQTSAQRTACAP